YFTMNPSLAPMHIIVDSREKDDLAHQLKLTGSVIVDIMQLKSGDACFMGNGPDDKEVMIGIERKKVPDLLSSINSSRLAGLQIPQMMKYYWRTLLIVEGQFRCHRERGVI